MSRQWLLRNAAGGVAGAILLGGLQACAAKAGPRPPDTEPGGQVLTHDAIVASGARDALEALEKNATHLLIQRTRDGTPVRIIYRGIDSFYLNPQVLIVIDGTPVTSVVSRLEGIPTESIAFIQILSGREASAKFGSNAATGVVLVRTTARDEGG